MKKIRFIAALLCLFLVNVIPVSANEEAGQPKVIDEVELLSNEEEAELTEQIISGRFHILPETMYVL